MTEIPQRVATSTDSDIGGIPPSLAELPQEVDAPEATPYVISFVNYNEKLCEINLLNNNKAKRAVELLKQVGMKIKSTADFQRNAIDRIAVENKGEYKKLFNRLPQDVELKEMKLQQEARIFFFDIEPRRTFYVVAITQNHYETDKVRR